MGFVSTYLWTRGAVAARDDSMPTQTTATNDRQLSDVTNTPRDIGDWSAEELHTQKMEAVGQLAGGIAHDLSNLMTAMFGWLEIASSQLPPDHAAREALKMVDRAAQQAVGLTRSLLTFSHRTPAKTSRILLNTSVRDVSRLLGRVLPASIDQRIRVSEEDVWIDGDDGQIQQVLMNLALNARDAVKTRGRIEIALDISPRRDLPKAGGADDFPDGAAVLRVTDTGCGIPEGLRPRIFEPFFTTKDRHRGTGLGLAIVHAIVTECSGCVTVESQIGRGSEFRVYLPRCSAPGAPCDASDTSGAGEESREVGVMVIEDNPHVRAMLTTVLVDAGHRVFEAADGIEGRALFADHRDDIEMAVVDLDLPKINGLDVLDALLKMKPETAAVVITGYPLSDESTRRLADMGCTLLRKPFQVTDLIRLVVDVGRDRRGCELNA